MSTYLSYLQSIYFSKAAGKLYLCRLLIKVFVIFKTCNPDFITKTIMLQNFFKTVVFLCLVLTSSCSSAQKTPHPVLVKSSPEKAGMSEDMFKQMDAAAAEFLKQTQNPGVIGFIARNGKVVYQQAIGYDDMEAKTPLEEDAIMRIASQTKAVTSVGIMMLFEEKKFLLDDPISKYLPAFRNPTVLVKFNPQDTTYTTKPAQTEITIRQLLTHTSGISYPTIGTREATAIYAKAGIPSGIGTPNGKLADAMNKLGKLPLMHQPGEKFTYGLSTDVLGYLIEVVSGQPLDVFFRTRIFEPLGMKDTYFYLPQEKQNRLAILYTEDANHKTEKVTASKHPINPNYPKVAGTYFSGGAGLSSTIQDYAIFLQMLLNEGEYNGKRLLRPETVQLMGTNQIGDVNNGDDKFGLGFGITSAKTAARLGVSEGNLEWGGIFGTTYWIDRKTGIIALLYSQKYPNSYGSIGDKFKSFVYQAITDKKEKVK